jgi:hypothetical protein
MKQSVYFQRNRIRTATGIAISLLLHASLFLFFRTHMPKPPEGTGNESRVPLVVELNRQTLGPKTAAPRPATPTPAIQPQPARPVAKKRPAPRPPAPPRTAVLPRSPAGTRPPPPPAPAPPTPENAQPASDMSDMVAAARARRRAAGIPSPDEPANAEATKPQGDEVARANIARSMAQARGRNGAGGLFHITSKGARNAEFLFRGWDDDSRAGLRELVQVDAGPNGNVEDAIVRKMIEIIRTRQSGDFNWESRRLGRVVTLSARRQDNAGLEDFLKREFFDTGR